MIHDLRQVSGLTGYVYNIVYTYIYDIQKNTIYTLITSLLDFHSSLFTFCPIHLVGSTFFEPRKHFPPGFPNTWHVSWQLIHQLGMPRGPSVVTAKNFTMVDCLHRIPPNIINQSKFVNQFFPEKLSPMCETRAKDITWGRHCHCFFHRLCAMLRILRMVK